jgi:hypothetical protein
LSELNNIWRLVRSGFVETKKRTPIELFYLIGKMLLILVLFKAISLGLIFLLDWFGIFEKPQNLNISKYENFTSIELLLLTALYGPIKEELTFRLALKFSKWNLIIAASGIGITLCRIIGLEYINSFIASLGIGVFFYFFLNTIRIEILSKFWSKNKLFIFYTLLIIFSFLHLRNYVITTELLLFSPIIVFPRILSGILYSYLRFNSGIIIAICFHSFNNGIFKVIRMIIE